MRRFQPRRQVVKTVGACSKVLLRGLPADARSWRRPSDDWAANATLTNLDLEGYAVLRDEDALHTKPCYPSALLTGLCDHIGVVITITETEAEAREAALVELAAARRHDGPAGERRWIHPLAAESLPGYDLRGILDEGEAEFVRNQLIHGVGFEATWQLAKQPECEGLMLPTEPATFFCFEPCLQTTVHVGAAIGSPVSLPFSRLHNVLDFVREHV